MYMTLYDFLTPLCNCVWWC